MNLNVWSRSMDPDWSQPSLPFLTHLFVLTTFVGKPAQVGLSPNPNVRVFSQDRLNFSEYDKKKKKKTKEEKCGKMDGDRGVHIPHSANKQKVNSSEGNTLTPDASHDPPPAHSGFP